MENSKKEKPFGLNGPGNSTEHQEAIADILCFLRTKFKNVKKYERYSVLPEIKLENRKVPDLVVYKRKIKTQKPTIIFEFTENNTNDDVQKCKDLMEEFKTIKEAFIFGLGNKEIKTLIRNKNGTVSKNIYKNKNSEIVKGVDFKKILKWE